METRIPEIHGISAPPSTTATGGKMTILQTVIPMAAKVSIDSDGTGMRKISAGMFCAISAKSVPLQTFSYKNLGFTKEKNL